MGSGSGSGSNGNSGGRGSGSASDPINACTAASRHADVYEYPTLSNEGMKQPYETPP